MTLNLVDADDVAVWMERPDLRSSERLERVVEMTNGLIEEKWTSRILASPIPPSVKLLALNVASRAMQNKPGHAPLQAVTRQLDDALRTERFAVSPSASLGVYLTDDELASLNPGTGSGTRSIRLVSSHTLPLT